ncbi:MAG TPA: sigma-54 dependent transcriptional regulator [Gemmatimonadales bacterium]|nr:sigma-54 dependent transcriptional regulator [Gemmatimonadales bacterium]
MSARILMVDDDANLRRMLAALLEEDGHAVRGVGTAAEAIQAAVEFDPDLVLLDLIIGEGPDGVSVLEQLKARDPELVVVMMSGKATLADAVRATRSGAFHFLEKPLAPETLLATTRAGLTLARARAEARAFRAAHLSDDEIVGASPAVAHVRRLIAQAAPTRSKVLITGESGTGKELVARAIHAQSPRAARPLVSVNCAAVPRDLLESELFGHEKGAFTGATQRREGKFELAHGGTLFLDEVGELEPAAQAKLLRVLETGVVERVGGTAGRDVDVRVIAATNQDLERAVQTGRFRRDLFFRLNVFPIVVPPLRERPQDLPLLITHLAGHAARRCNRPPRPFAEGALARLAMHHWPGNIRELANLIERLTILGEGPVTLVEVEPMLHPPPPSSTALHHPSPPGSLSSSLADYERRLSQDALTRANGNLAEAARSLQTDRANLHRRMRRLGMSRKDTDASK